MRNLLALLLDSAPDDLVRIAHWWQVDLEGVDLHQDVSRLYRTMTDPWSLAIIWDRMSDDERSVIGDLAGFDAEVASDELTRRVSTHPFEPPGDPTATIGRLSAAGWIFAEQTELPTLERSPSLIFIPRELVHLVRRLQDEHNEPSPLGLESDDLLARVDDQELYEIAQQVGYRVIPAVAARQDMLAFLAPRLGDPDAVRERMRMLDPTSARLFSALGQHNGQATPAEMRDELGLTATELRRSTRRLAGRALLWRGYDAEGSLRLIVPEVILHPRRPPPPEQPALQFIDVTKVDLPGWMPGYAIAWDLLTLLRDVAEGHGAWQRPGPERNLPTLRRLAKRFWFGQATGEELPPTGYLPFLLLLADSLGLVNPEHSAIVADRVREWTRKSFTEQMVRLESIWRATAAWPEGAGRDSLRVWGARWPEFRQELMAVLSEITPSSWLTLDSFAERFAVGHPNALGSQFTAAGGHEPGEASAAARRRSVIHQAAAMTVTTACHWLGLVRVTRTRGQGRQVVFQIGDPQSWQSDRASDNADSPLASRPLAVQPDFTMLLTQPEPRRVWALTAFSEPEPLDRVTTYRVSRASIQQGLSTGLSLSRITRFLEEESGEPIPQNVAFELGEWARAYRRVRLRRAILVEPDDRNSLAAIERALREEGARVERLGPQRLLIIPPATDPGLSERLEERLRALGQVPQWTGSG